MVRLACLPKTIPQYLPLRLRLQSYSMATSRKNHPGFAPLAASSTHHLQSSQQSHQLRGIVFDMDGTLCEPQNYMFSEMRSALAIDRKTNILDHINALAPTEQSEAFAKIQAIESDAMTKQVPQPGLVRLMAYLDEKGVKKAICTRNFDAPVEHFLQNHLPGHIRPFGPVVTRDFKPPKPSPAGILHIAHEWGVIETDIVPDAPPSERYLPLIMVGDSVDDMAAGRDAGALTVLLASEGKGQNVELLQDERTDVVVYRLDELVELLEQGLMSSR